MRYLPSGISLFFRVGQTKNGKKQVPRCARNDNQKDKNNDKTKALFYSVTGLEAAVLYKQCGCDLELEGVVGGEL